MFLEAALNWWQLIDKNPNSLILKMRIMVSASLAYVMVNFMCELDWSWSAQIKPAFWVCLCSYFWMKDEISSWTGGSSKVAALPSVNGHHSIPWELKWNKKWRKEELPLSSCLTVSPGTSLTFPSFSPDLGLGFTPLTPLFLRHSGSDTIIPLAPAYGTSQLP